MIEIAAAVFGLIQGALIMFNKRSNWIFYVIQMVLLAIFAWENHLYGDLVNNIIYVICGIVGWIFWGQNVGKDVKCNDAKGNIILAIYVLFFAGATMYLLGKTDDPLPFLDAFTTATSFVATYLMIDRKIEAWVIWFINDILYVIEYWLLPNQALYLLGLNVIWTFMAVGSFIMWRKQLKAQEAK